MGAVQARHVADLFAEKGHPGDFEYWRRGDRTGDDPRPDGITFWCPCGCGSLLGADFGPGKWTFDGNLEAPTVTPSILHLDGCRWHGFLTKGVFVPC